MKPHVVIITIMFSLPVAIALLQGDINSDNEVNLLDIQEIIKDWNKIPDGNYGSDVNADGIINLFDVMLVIANFGSKETNSTNQTQYYQNRIFSMGFTPFPPDFSQDAVDDVYAFIESHSDIVAHHLDSGIPWPEALAEQEFSDHLKNEWNQRKSRTPPAHAIYLAITPINWDRNNLAAYWGSSDNQPLPSSWQQKKFNDSDVKVAYFNYAKRAIDFFEPEYLAIGIESNILISKAPEKWNEYIDLNDFVYKELKKIHPNLTIFSTVQYEHLRGIEADSRANLALQEIGTKELMENSDLLALSTYQYGPQHNPVMDNYFDYAEQFGKPIAIAESGSISKDIKINNYQIHADELAQEQFISMILARAQNSSFAFVINFVAIDYDRLLDKLPPDIQEVAKAWVYTGLVNANHSNKLALNTWNEYFNLSHKTD